MKTNKYRALALGLLTAGALLAPATVSASFFLVGFHDFTGGSGADNSPIQVGAGVAFSGAVNKTSTGVNVGGSNSLTYGDAVTPVSNIPGGDGAVRLSYGSATFSITNNSLSSYTLDTLYFDAAHLTGSTLNHDVNVSFRYESDDDFTPVNTYFAAAAVGANNLSTYSKFSEALGFILGSGETIIFQFESISARIDNVAFSGSLTAVPEPSGLLALGGLVGAGFFLRSRSRRVVA